MAVDGTAGIQGEGEDGEDVTFVFIPAGWSKSTIPGLYGIVRGDRSDIEQEGEDDELDFSELTDQEVQQLNHLFSKTKPMPRKHERDGG